MLTIRINLNLNSVHMARGNNGFDWKQKLPNFPSQDLKIKQYVGC